MPHSLLGYGQSFWLCPVPLQWKHRSSLKCLAWFAGEHCSNVFLLSRLSRSILVSRSVIIEKAFSMSKGLLKLCIPAWFLRSVSGVSSITRLIYSSWSRHTFSAGIILSWKYSLNDSTFFQAHTTNLLLRARLSGRLSNLYCSSSKIWETENVMLLDFVRKQPNVLPRSRWSVLWSFYLLIYRLESRQLWLITFTNICFT